MTAYVNLVETGKLQVQVRVHVNVTLVTQVLTETLRLRRGVHSVLLDITKHNRGRLHANCVISANFQIHRLHLPQQFAKIALPAHT